MFDNAFWSTIPAIRGALEACRSLANAGYDLICVTALAPTFLAARERNLRDHGFPIHIVHATGNIAAAARPKAETVNALNAVAFVDDYAPYFVGVDSRVHRALVTHGASGSPNAGHVWLTWIPLTHISWRLPNGGCATTGGRCSDASLRKSTNPPTEVNPE